MKHFKILLPIVSLMGIQFFYFQYQLDQTRQQIASGSSQTAEMNPRTLQLPAFASLAEQAKQSVVSINVYNGDTNHLIDGMGSGFIISADGYLLTNFHVTHAAKRLLVKLSDGREFDAELIGSDPETDLSLIKIDAQGLRPFEFGNIEETAVGSWVVAVGAPFGLEQSVTAGIVSAKGRSVGEQYVPYIQTDVAINVGNSGGPLINMDGKVIGVNSKIYSTDGGSVGLSFAIPIDLAADVIEQLKNTGQVRRGYLGVRYQAVTKSVAQDFNLQQNRGALINEVTKGSPAELSGIEVGDIVKSVNGKEIVNYSELPFLIGRIRPGTETDLSIIRKGEKQVIKVLVGGREQDNPIVSENFEVDAKVNSLAIAVIDLPPETRESLNIQQGAMIERIEAGPAQQAGLQTGDIILSVQTKKIKNAAEFEAIVQTLAGEKALSVLMVRHDEEPRLVVINLGSSNPVTDQ